MRRRRRNRRPWTIAAVLVIAGFATWWFWLRPAPPARPAFMDPEPTTKPLMAASDEGRSTVPEVVLVEPEKKIEPPQDEILSPVGADLPPGDQNATSAETPVASAADPTRPDEVGPRTSAPQTAVSDLPGSNSAESTATPPAERLSANPRINSVLQRYQAGEVITARTELNRMLEISRDEAEQTELRRHLQTIADATVFSREVRDDDPLFESYIVKPSEYLINIGKQFKTPYESIMLINGITNAARLREGQKLKVPHGPFNVKIERSKYRLDLYLQDLYIRSFPVGLGADQGTPLGEWIVKDRLPNPTYYPPASSPIKKIMSPNDPANPLGEHWIGLTGVSGDAVGHTGYGIHGTIEPESIGKAVSLGCVRMNNPDVEYLYKFMMPGASKVVILP